MKRQRGGGTRRVSKPITKLNRLEAVALAGEYKKTARAPATMATYRYFCKRYKAINNLPDWEGSDMRPPPEFMTNANIEVFLAFQWQERKHKPAVEQAKKWLNHVLTTEGRPTINMRQRKDYAGVIDLLASIRKKPEWRNYEKQGARPLPMFVVERILNADTRNAADPDGRPDPIAVRNKAIAAVMIVLGAHPKDMHRMHENDFVDAPQHRDREGWLRPKIVIRDVMKTKEHWLKGRNVLGCGCKGHHTAANLNCMYNIIKHYVVLKTVADLQFLAHDNGLVQLNRKQRRFHADEEGRLKPTWFWRSWSKKHERFNHNRINDKEIRNVFKYWNGRLQLGLLVAQGAQARKTSLHTVGDSAQWATSTQRKLLRIHGMLGSSTFPDQS